MTVIDTVVLKVPSRCNIYCRYCYVYNMGDTGWTRGPKQMSRGTCQAAVSSLASLVRYQGQPFAVVLHGGEPLLLGAANLEFFISTLRSTLPVDCAISVQTNGMMINREILDLCAQAGVSISLSLDGPRHVHDRNRVGFAGDGTFERVMVGLEMLRAHPESEFLFAGLLAVVDPESNPGQIYSFFKSLCPPSVDFIYKDGNHSRLPSGKKSISSTEYGQWMVELLDIYLADNAPIRIRILDDIIKLFWEVVGQRTG